MTNMVDIDSDFGALVQHLPRVLDDLAATAPATATDPGCGDERGPLVRPGAGLVTPAWYR
jgi:hypothetical protein